MHESRDRPTPSGVMLFPFTAVYRGNIMLPKYLPSFNYCQQKGATDLPPFSIPMIMGILPTPTA